MRLTIGEILAATGGRLEAGAIKDFGDGAVTGVSTDTRTVKAGELFVALKGEIHDGHDHVEEAAKKGATAILVHRDVPFLTPHAVRVKDTMKALGDLARYWRRKFPVPVVGVTGSNGKTTAKDLIAAVLGTRYRVLKTEGNFNNLIGLPLTIFRMRGDEDVAVFEMGMNRPGEIDRLAEVAEPSVSVITTIARAHLEGLGGLVNVAKAKGELLDRLPAGGLAVLPADNVYFDILAARARKRGARVESFGLKKGSDYRALSSRMEGLRAIAFEAAWEGRRESFRMSVAGRHNALNALAAIAVADHFQVPVAGIKKALAGFRMGAKRMEIVSLRGGVEVINDCYNANPDSTIASLDFLHDLALWKKKGRNVVVIGEMLELGAFAKKSHEEVGRRAAQAGAGLLIAVGPHSKDVAAGARRAGLASSHAYALADVEEALPLLKSLLRKGDLVLVKGSRGMKMERITEGLKTDVGATRRVAPTTETY